MLSPPDHIIESHKKILPNSTLAPIYSEMIGFYNNTCIICKEHISILIL